MSSYVDHWRSLAVGFSVALVSAFATAEMTCTALAQDQGSWSAVSAMPTGTGDSGVAALDGKDLRCRRFEFLSAHCPDISRHGFGHVGLVSQLRV